MADKCEHKFRYDTTDHRWWCVRCSRVAPKCFQPKLEAIAL